jgi:hypothetical protein
MIRTIVESPYRATDVFSVEQHMRYLEFCLADSILNHQEAPTASHEWLCRVLDDDNPRERALGIAAGYRIGEVFDRIAFYVDLGWSHGMREAQKYYTSLGKEIVERTINFDFVRAIQEMD